MSERESACFVNTDYRGMDREIGGTVCVTGANGFLASLLVKRLLEIGFVVHATVRDPANETKVCHLNNIPGAEERLKIFKADLSIEGSFDSAVLGCVGVFHVATPSHFFPKDHEKEVILPAVNGAIHLLESCLKAKTVKRVVMTSSLAAYTIHAPDDHYQVIDESCWTNVEYLSETKTGAWAYAVSKALAEKAALEYAEKKGVPLVTVAPPLILGRAVAKEMRSASSIMIGASLLTGNADEFKTLRMIEKSSKCVSVIDAEDAVSAHIHLYLHPSVKGRYLCCPLTTSISKLSKLVSERYPQYSVAALDPSEALKFDEEVSLCSRKLMETGFSFAYPTLDAIYDRTVHYLQDCGMLSIPSFNYFHDS